MTYINAIRGMFRYNSKNDCPAVLVHRFFPCYLQDRRIKEKRDFLKEEEIALPDGLTYWRYSYWISHGYRVFILRCHTLTTLHG